jgi:hypothetical protein
MGDVPSVLASPPWVPARKRPKLELAELPPIPDRIEWMESTEQARWSDPSPEVSASADKFAALDPETRDREILTLIASRGILPIYAGRHLSLEAMGIALEKAERHFIDHYKLAQIALAKYGLEALGVLVMLAGRMPDVAMKCFLRIDSVQIAELLETKFIDYAAAYYERFPQTSARRLVRTVLVGNAKESAQALRALAVLIEQGHEAVVLAQARAFGDGCEEELRERLAPPALPPKPPKLPPFVDLATLPAPATKSGARLDAVELERLVELMACLPLEAAKTALESVNESCDAASLGDLSRVLVERWAAADAPSKEKWVIAAAALLGDDLATHRIAENVAAWAEQGKHPRVAAGVEALASAGGDIALMHLARFAEKSKVKNLKKKAQAALDAYCEEHGMTADELGDRIVPDLGLDARGELTLSYGPRSFRVVFDDSLKVSLRSGDAPMRSLPKAAATDDAQLVERAHATWEAIKKETKPILEAQTRRLERAMARRRAWSRDQFERYHLRHPLMQHFARRLVWGAFDGASLALSFRIAEDGSFANALDAPTDVPSSLTIGIVHPLALGREAVGRWGDILGDYQIVQPFPQLARETFAIEPAETSKTALDRFAGVPVQGARFYALRHRGWEFVDYDIGKRLSGGRSATLATQPGLGFLAMKPDDQTLGALTLMGGTFGELDAVEASELVRDVEMLRR